MPERPYFGHSVTELDAVFASSLSDSGILTQLLDELRHRSTVRAKRLREQVEQRLRELGEQQTAPRGSSESHPEPRADGSQPAEAPEPEQPRKDPRCTADRAFRGGEQGAQACGSADDEPPDDRRRPETLTRITAPGVGGRPSAYVPRLKTTLTIDLPGESTRARRYAHALEALIREMRKTGKGNRCYALENGTLLGVEGDLPVYSFPFPDRADLFEDTRVEIEAEGRRRSGQLVSVANGTLQIALDEHLGPVIRRCVLIIDNTALIEVLKDRLDLVDQGKLEVSLDLANCVVDRDVWPPEAEPVPAHSAEHLNPDQRAAVEAVLGTSVSYIWGPPGTGKTQTLSAVVEALFNAEKRILICSNTNNAVDQLLMKLCERLQRDHPALVDGKVLRVPRISLQALRDQYEDLITVEGITDRLSRDLKLRQTELEEQVAGLEQRGRSIRRDLELFEAVSRVYEEIASLRRQLQKQQSQRQEALSACGQARKRAAQWQREHEELSAAGPLRRVFMRSAEKITADIRSAEAEAERLEEAARDAAAEAGASAKKIAERELAAAEAARSLDGRDQDKLKKTLSEIEAGLEPLVAELQEIARKLADVRASIIRDARILGMTVTKATMSTREIGRFDTVIIDEASMVMLPALYFVAGLATERVIVSGDFRQLPPIVESEEQAIHDLIGMDVFTAVGIDERDEDADEGEPRCLMLREQYRMTDEICRLIARPMYGGRLFTSAGRRPPEHMARPPAPFDGALTIVDTSALWPFEGRNAFGSRYNLLHALLVRNLAGHLRDQGFLGQDKALGVCSPYSAQAKLLASLLEGDGNTENVMVGTVHRFQGDERRMMILDIPESVGPAWSIGLFVQGLSPDQIGARLINVAVSRAQEHLVVFANLTYLDKRLPSTALLRSVLYGMQSHGSMVDAGEVLKLRPVERDIKDLLGVVELDLDEKRLGLFHSRSFGQACMYDMSRAQESIVVLSGFVTLQRVSAYAELFRAKIAEGVKIRCVTRPPQHNASIPSDVGRQALDALEGLGVVVDCRKRIHEKIVLIDNRIVWSGSLNPLSHTSRTDEFMSRAVNPDYAEKVAAFISKRPGGHTAVPGPSAVEAENPRCPSCSSRTFYAEGRYGPYFSCEDDRHCRWKASAASAFAGADCARDGGPCPLCGRPTTLRQGRWGPFYGCTDYPACDGTLHADNRSASSGRARRTGSGRRSHGSRQRRQDRQRQAAE